MDQWDTLKFREIFCDAITSRIGIGADLAEGFLEAVKQWGRLEQDMNAGTIRLPAWGASWHHCLPGVDWAYSYIFMSGDPMWHGFFGIGGGGGFGGPPSYTAEELVRIGNNIWNLQHQFNLREGETREEYTFPSRFYEEDLPAGSTTKKRLDKDQVDQAVKRYFSLKGWDF